MKNNTSDIYECLWHIEDSPIVANHYLHEVKTVLREPEDK